MNKSLIVGLIIVSVLVLLVGCSVSISNRAISMEENINSVQADVTVQEQRRVDLILRLVEVVEQYSDYEPETLTNIVEMRQSASAGNLEKAMGSLNVVVEAYPDLKANELYKQLMTELSVTENLLAEHRKTVNSQVKVYSAYVRKFPNSMVLGMFGYQVIDFQYVEFDQESTTMPDSLFDN